MHAEGRVSYLSKRIHPEENQFMKSIVYILIFPLAFTPLYSADSRDVVLKTPGLVAFWDFVAREADGGKRFCFWKGVL